MDRVLSNIGTVQGRQFATSILRLSNCELGKRVTSSRIDILFLVEDELRWLETVACCIEKRYRGIPKLTLRLDLYRYRLLSVVRVSTFCRMIWVAKSSMAVKTGPSSSPKRSTETSSKWRVISLRYSWRRRTTRQGPDGIMWPNPAGRNSKKNNLPVKRSSWNFVLPGTDFRINPSS